MKRGNHAERTPSEVEAAVEARLPYLGCSFDCARLRLAPLPGLRLGQAGCSGAHEIGMHPSILASSTWRPEASSPRG